MRVLVEVIFGKSVAGTGKHGTSSRVQECVVVIVYGLILLTMTYGWLVG